MSGSQPDGQQPASDRGPVCPPRVSLITLGVTDVAVSTEFYERLGWRRSSASQDSITFFQTEGSVLALYEHTALAADAEVRIRENRGPSFRGVTIAINFDDETAVDASFSRWLESGATAVVRPHTTFWGGYSSYVADPDGHLWELAHNPYAPNGTDGRMQLP